MADDNNLKFSIKDNLNNAWASNPSFRISAIAVGVILVLAIGIAVANVRTINSVSPSRMTAADENIKDSPFEEKSVAYKDALQEDEQQRLEAAIKKGQSVLPYTGTFESQKIGDAETKSATNFLSLADLEKIGFDDNKKVVKPKPKAKDAKTVKKSTKTQGNVTVYTPEQSQERAQAIGTQMSSLVNVTDPVYNQIIVTDVASLTQPLDTQGYGEPKPSDNAMLEDIDRGDLIVSAGTISYAVTLTESNSDVKGPVLAKILTGPLKGFRTLGNFVMQDDYLTIQFNKAALGDEEYSIEAFALDPTTTLPGVASEVDRHYFNRVLLPIAASFIEGLGNAISDQGSDVFVSDGVVTESTADKRLNEEVWEAAGEAGQKLGKIVDDAVVSGPTVKLYAGAEIGMLFTSAVYGRTGTR